MAMCPTLDTFNALFVFYSDERVTYYFETLTKMPMQELVIALEGFCLSGIKGKYLVFILNFPVVNRYPGMMQNHWMQLGDWKKKVKEFILKKLGKYSCHRAHSDQI